MITEHCLSLLLAIEMVIPNVYAFQSSALSVQTIRGVVVDALTGEPLPGANVVVIDSDPLIGTSTKSDGSFIMTHVPLGRRVIRVSFLGYRPKILSAVRVGAGKEVVLTIEMQQQVFKGEDIVVMPEIQKDSPLNEMVFVSARSFSVEETRRYAGGLDDPARMATAFAGVTSTGGVQNNALAIRGNAPKSMKWYLEGVEIPNPNHFAGLSVMGGGGLTLFSGQLLSNSDFMTGAFPARYGDALSGIFDMHFRSGNPVQREYTAQLGLNGIEVASEGPFSRKDASSSTYLLNYRYSTLALLMPLLPTEGSIRYQDLSFKMDFHTSHAGRISLWGIGGLDAQSMDANNDSTEWEYEFWDRVTYDMHLGVGAAGISHSILLGQDSNLKSTVAITFNQTSWNQKRLDENVILQPNLDIANSTGSIIVKTMFAHRFSKTHQNRSGASIRHLFYNLDVRAATDNEPPLVSYSYRTGGSELIQAFTESRYQLSARLIFQAGLHMQWFTLNDEVQIEPRSGLQWQISD